MNEDPVSAALDAAGATFDDVYRGGLLRRWAKGTKHFAHGAPLITVDEVNHDALTPFPKRDDVDIILDQCDSGEDLIIWKSRQHFCSHAVMSSSLWLALFTRERSIAYVAQDEGEGKSHVESRLVGMMERTPAWFQKMYRWNVKGGTFVVEEREGKPWRSFVEPMARGSKKTRSWSWSRIHFDEAALNELLEPSFTGAYSTVRGARDPKTGLMKKGQIILTSSAMYHKFMINLSGVMLEEGLEMARRVP